MTNKEKISILIETIEAVPENFNMPDKALKYSTGMFVEGFLTKNNIPYKELNGNIYSLANKNRPLLSAHMDSVGHTWPLTEKMTEIVKEDLFFKDNGSVIGGKSIIQSKFGLNIGADDRCGVAGILAILKEIPDINFIFSRQEEKSPHSVEEVIKEEGKEAFSSFPFCLVLDRKGRGDLIGDKRYCDNDFTKALEGLNFGYKSVVGSICDADQLCKVVPTTNISVGYYDAHSATEYIVISEWINATNFVKEAIDKFTVRFKLYEAPIKKSYGNFGGYWANGVWHSYDEPLKKIKGRKYVDAVKSSLNVVQEFPNIKMYPSVITEMKIAGTWYIVDYDWASLTFSTKNNRFLIDDDTFEYQDLFSLEA